MPFRYGIATMVDVPHVVLSLEMEDSVGLHHGVSADHLPPKWFTKDPETHFRDDLVGMLDVIEAACAHAVRAGDAESVFDLWWLIHAEQASWASGKNKPLSF